MRFQKLNIRGSIRELRNDGFSEDEIVKRLKHITTRAYVKETLKRMPTTDAIQKQADFKVEGPGLDQLKAAAKKRQVSPAILACQILVAIAEDTVLLDNVLDDGVVT